MFLIVNSSKINKPFKEYNGKISVTMQNACEMPEANAVKVAEKNQCLAEKVEKDSSENKWKEIFLNTHLPIT